MTARAGSCAARTPAAHRAWARTARALAGFAAAAGALAAAAGSAAQPSSPVGDFEARFASCLGCHGENGHSTTPMTPSLGGQPAFYAMTQLFLLRDGRRGEPEMIEQARSMTNDDLRAFSAAIAKLPAPPLPTTAPHPERFDRGRKLAARHRCGACHNPDFSGREQIPRLANQREDYLLKSMREFASGRRIGYGAAMTQELAGLSDEALVDLAHFLAHFGARKAAPSG